jgi:hypothetical protein
VLSDDDHEASEPVPEEEQPDISALSLKESGMELTADTPASKEKDVRDQPQTAGPSRSAAVSPPGISVDEGMGQPGARVGPLTTREETNNPGGWVQFDPVFKFETEMSVKIDRLPAGPQKDKLLLVHQKLLEALSNGRSV